MKNKILKELSKKIKNEILEIKEITNNNLFFIFDNTSSISSLIFKELEELILLNLNIYLKIYAISQEELIINNKNIAVQNLRLIYFNSLKELNEYENQQEELQKIDHRFLGKKMNLFEMLPISPGSVFWLKKGVILYNKLQEFIRKNAYKNFEEVKTPFVMSNSLWKTSGHLSVFSKNMMFVNLEEKNEEQFALKPMNCPGHVELYKTKLRTFKDLPLRIAEFGGCHRYEPSGALFGLMRVRSFVIDDGHIFCVKEQIKSEVSNFILNALNLYKKFTFEDINIIISTKPENSLGKIEDWEYSEKILQESLKENNLNFKIAHGEGAFYGPKIEIQVKDSMQRVWQLGTIQLDFVLPERFNISFMNKNQEKEIPCMLHRAVFGSIERFIGVLLEHTKGNLPLFISPIPIAICSVNSKSNIFAQELFNKLNELEIVSILDLDDDNLSNKIKKYKTEKIPLIIVIGEKEAESNIFSIEYNQKKMQYNIKELRELKKFINDN